MPKLCIFTPCEASLYQSLKEDRNTLFLYRTNQSVNNGEKSQQIPERQAVGQRRNRPLETGRMGSRTSEGKSTGGILIRHSFSKIQREISSRCLAGRYQMPRGLARNFILFMHHEFHVVIRKSSTATDQSFK